MAYSASTRQWKYDVFLSFRGADVRKSFLSHLYGALRQKGVNAFKDDKELERGKPISDDLLQAIKDSRFCIIIFSKRYADSTWCLDELVTIYECVQQEKLIAIPVFYGVETSKVQDLDGYYGKAFEKHEKDYEDDIQKVQKWKVVIKELALHSGYTLEESRDEEEFIYRIVGDIIEQLRKLRQRSPEEGLVGIDKHLQQLNSYLSEKSNDICIIGICGIGGIGKTTIARAFFNKMSRQFEESSFLANIQEVEKLYGLVHLQEQLLYDTVLEKDLRIYETHKGIREIENRLWHRKVLIVLDDIDNLEQLKSLAGKSNWFGSGSTIIITTKDESLLRFYEECLIYKVPKLDLDDALQLFYFKTFRNGSLSEGFEDLSYKFVKYCDGLPLAIDVLGSLLRGVDSKDEWNSALLRLKEIPDKKIIDKLKISFDKLQETEQKIFLDIACFFNGKDQDHVKQILESCGFYPDIGMRVLINKSLITIDPFNLVWMHDLLQKMGKEIVRRQSPEEPGKRSRIWLCKDVYHALLNNTRMEMVEGIMIEDSHEQEVEWSNVEALSIEAFSKMNRLRLLKVQYLQISCGFEFLPNSLRYFDWNQFPSKSLPNQFQPNELVELHMCQSNITYLWKGIKPLKKLRVINLSHSKKLKKTPDFTEVPKLETLNLEGCTSLFEIHHSIGVLKELVLLNLKDCKNIIALPNSIGDLKSLKVLNLRGCSRLMELPKSLGQLTSLQILKLSIVGKEQRLAKSRDFLMPWKRATNPMSLTLPSSMWSLCSLKELDLSYCHLNGELPNDFSCLPLLEILNLTGNDFAFLPSSINKLSRLKYLLLVDWRKRTSTYSLMVDVCFALEVLLNPSKFCRIGLLWIAGVNCFKFVKNQHKTNIVCEWLASYLRLVLIMKNNGQEFRSPSFNFSMCFPGNAIPEWFSFRSSHHTSMIVSLPPNWCNDQWLGFAICINLCPIPNMITYDPCYLHLYVVGVYRHFLSLNIEKKMQVTSDQLWVVFTPMALFQLSGLSVDWWNKARKIEIKCYGTELKMKSCGFRIVYEQDIKELLQYNCPCGTQKFLTIHDDEIEEEDWVILDKNQIKHDG